MGVPNSSNGDLFHNVAQLPISRFQWARESKEHMRLLFLDCEPLPGAEKLLLNLSRAHSVSSGDKIKLGLASSTHSDTYQLKTSRPKTKALLSFFQDERRVLGDDPRVRQGRGKPAPDIYLLALEILNSEVSSEMAIKPSECLVFEDSTAGVEAGRHAGMRVVWVPHPDLGVEYQARQTEILAGRSEILGVEDDSIRHLEAIENGWVETIPSLEHFDYKKYSIKVPPE